MKEFTQEQFKEIVVKVNNLVGESSLGGSALNGLRAVVLAFGVVCDIYAAPNSENPEGMCDDKAAFRGYFADMLAQVPEVDERKSA